MQLEIKIVLESSRDYELVVNTLQPRFIKEESYRDYFFDFANGELASTGSVLRLRVPCAALTAPSLSPGGLHSDSADASATPEYSAHRAYEDFMHSCVAPATQPHITSLVTSSEGKLVFKQRNTVERGEQMNFVVEDNKVPADVVARLIANVDLAHVLEEYAQRKTLECAGAGGSASESSAQTIISKLKLLAARAAEARAAMDENSATNSTEHHASGMASQWMNSEAQQDNAFYGQMRYAVGAAGANVVTASQEDQLCIMSSLCSTGNYSTTRMHFQYLCASAADLQAMTPDDRELRERLQVRVDLTVYPFGSQYELEVPRIPCAQTGDVLAEVQHFLKALGVRHQLGSEGKYACFLRGLRGANTSAADVRDVKLRLTSVQGYLEVRKNLEEIVLTSCQPHTDKRSIANTDLNTSGQAPDSANNGGFASTEESHENFFLDGPKQELRQQHAFLRLRRYNQGVHFALVLKEKQCVTGGAQSSRTSVIDLPEAVAQSLLENPTSFLTTQHTHNAVMNKLWSEYGLRELVPAAFFTTSRITVPWLASKTQKAFLGSSASNPSVYQSTQLGMTPAYVPATQHHVSVGGMGISTLGMSAAAGSSAPSLAPLLIHLDRTTYPLNENMTVPQTQAQSVRYDYECGTRAFEIYEVEVTNLSPATAPADVLQELTNTLHQMGVEWQRGTQSKLDQFYSLLGGK